MKRFEEIREKLQILRKERDENPVTPEIIATCDDYIRLKDEIRANGKEYHAIIDDLTSFQNLEYLLEKFSDELKRAETPLSVSNEFDVLKTIRKKIDEIEKILAKTYEDLEEKRFRNETDLLKMSAGMEIYLKRPGK